MARDQDTPRVKVIMRESLHLRPSYSHLVYLLFLIFLVFSSPGSEIVTSVKLNFCLPFLISDTNGVYLLRILT